MHRWRTIWRRHRVIVLIAAALLVLCGEASARPAVSAASVQDFGDRTRVEVVFDQRVDFRLFGLSSPDRVVIDMKRVRWRAGGATLSTESALVQRLRYGVFNPQTSRLVIDCARPARVTQARWTAAGETGRHRLIVDLVAVTAKTANGIPRDLAKLGAGTAALRLPPPPNKPLPPAPPRVIVLDPGHGGVDPGARGVSGMQEKELTLKVARQVRDRLQRAGRYRVVLTRDSDVFVKLRRRVEIARAAGAELFLSLHADAHPDGRVRGASVYTLSEHASDAEAAALAERENKVDLIAGVDLSEEPPEVTNILIDLARRETRNQSSRLAGDLVQELRQHTRLLRNSHRFAGFAVLTAPDVPSVLLELGYLSNRRDEALLRRADHIDAMADAIVRAIDRYFTAVRTADRG